ncbi:hypothetical protein SAMN06265338_101389 [Rhodoblastus acidophilus]|uniref:DUF2188 domain-containing protein n=1 Tax=Rhodoblastus acidophilus TaxID=1074 RepID=A0A212Q540_RHOAC|nr:hypothetical protein [Rhodoblastus acidophilus]MCW2316562.1 hypothetical protein [Rhodoblastus acidophilus]PPQ36367.1 hypothetical protein CKO16_18235 [Rhodoblastus acidophilus]RAI16635.1 hypothetical protein CH337_20305 [Rhodoblastus acidophilus]SNB54340.1 hypothetical protein SAMN06265338_101389 [Rhodoblastus acidophilus]
MNAFERSEDSPRFVIGRDTNGFWAARSADGQEGGLFVSRDQAEKFARERGAAVARKREPVRLWPRP